MSSYGKRNNGIKNYSKKTANSKSGNNKAKTKNFAKVKIAFVGLIIIILVLMGFGIIPVKDFAYNVVVNLANNNMNAGKYDLALRKYEMGSYFKPFDVESVRMQVVALSKMPLTYDNISKLYEISQYNNFDAASEEAEKILDNVRKKYSAEIGSNYTDNVLYNNMLVRWNNTVPVTYAIDTGKYPDTKMPAKNAFWSWSSMCSDVVKLKETGDINSADIVVHITNDISRENDKKLGGSKYAISKPKINENVLERVDIYVKCIDEYGQKIDSVNLRNLIQHQIGHALGLWGHSALFYDVMSSDNEYINPLPHDNILTGRDINTLRAIYNMVPDVVNIPIEINDTSKMYFHRILTEYPGENYKYEITRLLSLLDNDRSNIVEWVNLANNYAIMRQFERSNYILQSILPLVSNSPDNTYIVYYNLAMNYYRMKNTGYSRYYLKKAVQIKDDKDTQVLDAFLNFDEGKLNIAKQKLMIIRESIPDNIEVGLKIAEICFRESDQAGEVNAVNYLIEHNPEAKHDRRVAKYLQKRNKFGI